MTATATIKDRKCWGQGEFTPPEVGAAIAAFRHADPERGQVALYRVGPNLYWITYLIRPYLRDDATGRPTGDFVREWCQLSHVNTATWGKVREARCHTADRSHPWNDGKARPGYHTCSACGYPAWLECHGVADGQCQCCGYHG